jgi:uncharacterized membrane protein
MIHLESVTTGPGGRSHWVAKAPGGSVEWDAEITEDQPGELLSWQSIEGADVANGGSVRFADAPGDRGTEIHVALHYDPPGGTAGAMVAKLFGEEPSQQLLDDLRRFKQVMETGEVVRSEGVLRAPAKARRPNGRPRRSGVEGSHEGHVLDGERQRRSARRPRATDSKPA